MKWLVASSKGLQIHVCCGITKQLLGASPPLRRRSCLHAGMELLSPTLGRCIPGKTYHLAQGIWGNAKKVQFRRALEKELDGTNVMLLAVRATSAATCKHMVGLNSAEREF